MGKKVIHKILRYKRECDSWLCPECDAENSLISEKCIVCGISRPSNLKILKAWTEEDKKTETSASKKTPESKGEPIFKDEHKYIPESKERNIFKKIFWCVIISIFIIGFLVAVIQSYVCADAIDALNYGDYIISTTTLGTPPSKDNNLNVIRLIN